jgi:hypothetical protein
MKYNNSRIKIYNKKGNYYDLKYINDDKMNGMFFSKNGIQFKGSWISSKDNNNRKIFVQREGIWCWLYNGDWFKGTFENNILYNGSGKRTLKNGNIFYGQWKKGFPYLGLIKWNNGNWFEGLIKNYKPFNGKGKLFLDNGCYFQGKFKNGYLLEGISKWLSIDKHFLFEGSVLNNKIWEGKKINIKTQNITTIKNGKECKNSDKCLLDILSIVACQKRKFINKKKIENLS